MLKSAPIVPYIPATDVARARKFYEEKAGLVPREEVAGGVVYECGDRLWIFLYPSGGAGTSKASQAFWQVKDVEAEVAELKSRGVVFEEYEMPGLKTVLMSGYTSHSAIRQALADTAVRFIQKPFTKQELEQAIRELLEA